MEGTHPDVSSYKDNCLYAHSFVLGALFGGGNELSVTLQNKNFNDDEILHIGLQDFNEYQKIVFAREDHRNIDSMFLLV